MSKDPYAVCYMGEVSWIGKRGDVISTHPTYRAAVAEMYRLGEREHSVQMQDPWGWWIILGTPEWLCPPEDELADGKVRGRPVLHGG